MTPAGRRWRTLALLAALSVALLALWWPTASYCVPPPAEGPTTYHVGR